MLNEWNKDEYITFDRHRTGVFFVENDLLKLSVRIKKKLIFSRKTMAKSIHLPQIAFQSISLCISCFPVKFGCFFAKAEPIVGIGNGAWQRLPPGQLAPVVIRPPIPAIAAITTHFARCGGSLSKIGQRLIP